MSTQAPTTPAPCLKCGGPGIHAVVQASNQNGNAYRPYIKCLSCGGFITFTDDRGLDPNNPICDDCRRPSRRQVTGWDNRVPWAIHFVCSEGRCPSYKEEIDEEGNQVVLQRDDMDECIRRRFV